MTQEQKDLVINHIAAAFNAYRNGQTAAMDALLDITRKAAKAYTISSIQAHVAYLRTNETNDVAERTFCENLSHMLKVRELEKLAKELEAAEAQKAIERNLAEADERRAISDEVNAAREAVLEAACDDKRAEAEARMRQLIENHEFASTEYRDALRALAQEYAGDDAIVESFPVAVEYLRDCFLKCYDGVQIYGCSMALTFPRCRLVKDEAREAWREVEDKYWGRLRFARRLNRYSGAGIDEYQIAQEFAEAVLPLCKLDELKKLEKELEEEKKRAAQDADDAAQADDVAEADVWTDDDFAIRPEDAYVETMKAVAIEDMEEPVEWTEYLAEYRKTRVKFHAKRMARDLAYFLETRGFTLDDCDKAEWWQTLAQRFWSLDDFIQIAKAGGLKHIEDYLRNGRKLTTQKARRALLRIARAHTESCL